MDQVWDQQDVRNEQHSRISFESYGTDAHFAVHDNKGERIFRRELVDANVSFDEITVSKSLIQRLLSFLNRSREPKRQLLYEVSDALATYRVADILYESKTMYYIKIMTYGSLAGWQKHQAWIPKNSAKIKEVLCA